MRDLYPGSLLPGELLGSLAIITLLLPAILYAGHRVGIHPFYPLVIWGVSTGVGMAFHHTASPFYHSPNDSNGYQVWAYQVLDGEIGIASAVDLLNTKLLWPSVIAFFYNYFGQAQLLIILLNSGVLALTMLVSFKAAHLFWGKAPIRCIALLFFLNPPLLFFASSLGRESFFLFFISLLALGASLVNANRRNWAFLVLSLGVVGAAVVRPNLGFLTILALGTMGGIALIVSGRRSRIWSRIVIGMSILVVSAVSYVPFANFVVPADVDTIIQTRQELDVGSTAFGEQEQTAFGEQEAPGELSPKGNHLLTTLLASFLRAGLGPFPWEWSPSLLGLFYSSSALYWFAVLVGAVISLAIPQTRAITIIFLGIAALQVGAISVEAANYGLVMRVRLSAFVTLLPIGLVGLSRYLEDIAARRARHGIKQKFWVIWESGKSRLPSNWATKSSFSPKSTHHQKAHNEGTS